MTLTDSPKLRPWTRAGIVALQVGLAVLCGTRIANACSPNQSSAREASAPSSATAAAGVNTSAPEICAAEPRRPAGEGWSGAAGLASLRSAAQTASPDFSFGQPRFSIAFRGLLQRPRAEGDFHRLLHESFFVRTSPEDDPFDPDAGRMNFDATGIGMDVGIGIGSRLEARVGLDYALARALTEDRFNEDEFGLPIEQNTSLAQWSIHGDLVFALTPRGRSIGQYVWIPSAVIPYVGAGAGFVRYDTLMTGRFVDVVDYTIFADTIESQGWAPSVHAFGGVDFRLTQHILLTTEARYSWATAELDGALAGFDHDLTGLRISAGIRFVF